ncbi:MAG: ribosome small subunit-dependent GTPase, partial [Moorea sp. SIO3I6]|nr:ribosome small subunit-dependent GTPase [Moorena sp. SIO3I6]
MIELEYTNSSNLSTRWLGTVLAVQANFYQVRLDQLKVDKLEVVGCEDNLQANNLQPS